MISGADAWRVFCPSYAGGYVGPVQAVRDEQIQVVPAPFGQALRFEVRHDDVYRTYSDSRALITGPAEMWEDEGNERWYRWRAMWPPGWVGSYPKWDEPGARSGAGSSLEWHHEPFGGGVETGSAPLYIWADEVSVRMGLVDQKTSTFRKTLVLAPLKLDHWYEFLFHIIWSSDKKKGLIEAFADGVAAFVVNDYTMYLNTRMYPVAGLYRNGHIGESDPSGLPGFMFSGGFARGATRAEVEDTTVAQTAAVAQPPSVNLTPFRAWRDQLVEDRKAFEEALAKHDEAIIGIQGAITAGMVQSSNLHVVLDEITASRDVCQKALDQTIALLDQGPHGVDG